MQYDHNKTPQLTNTMPPTIRFDLPKQSPPLLVWLPYRYPLPFFSLPPSFTMLLALFWVISFAATREILHPTARETLTAGYPYTIRWTPVTSIKDGEKWHPTPTRRPSIVVVNDYPLGISRKFGTFCGGYLVNWHCGDLAGDVSIYCNFQYWHNGNPLGRMQTQEVSYGIFLRQILRLSIRIKGQHYHKVEWIVGRWYGKPTTHPNGGRSIATRIDSQLFKWVDKTSHAGPAIDVLPTHNQKTIHLLHCNTAKFLAT